MPILRSYLAGRERRAVSYQDVWGAGKEWTAELGSTPAGSAITRERSLRFSTVFSCIGLLAETWSSLPVDQFKHSGTPAGHMPKRSAELAELEARRNPIDELADIAALEARARQSRDHGVPVESGFAPWIFDPSGRGDTEFSLSEAISVSLSIGGNYYAECIANPRTGEPMRLHALDPKVVTPKLTDTGEKVFVVRLDSGAELTAPLYRRGMRSGIVHIPGLRVPGALAGLAPLELAKEAVALGLTAQDFGALFFSNGARPDLVIQLPAGTKATGEIMDRLRKGWADRHAGTAKAHRPGVLSDGAELKEISIPNDHAQFLETREFQRADIASWFRVPPHLVGVVSKSTSWGTGLEEQSAGFARYTLSPMIRRAELVLSKLLPAKQFVRWNLVGLERASLLKRYQSYAIGRQNGWLSANDVRELEDMPRLEEGGDEYLVPLNMTPADELDHDDDDDTGGAPAGDDEGDEA